MTFKLYNPVNLSQLYKIDNLTFLLYLFIFVHSHQNKGTNILLKQVKYKSIQKESLPTYMIRKNK